MVALVALVALVAAACAAPAPSGSAPSGSAPSGSAAATAGSKPRGGTLVVAAASDPGQLNPAITTAGGTHFVADNLYNGLVFLDVNLEPKPDLADSWTVSPDAKTYTFNLHKGVKWHDGIAVTSADVKFTFEQVLLKYHARTKSGLESVLAGIDAPDDNTVVFRFKQPYGPLLQRVDVVETPIIAKHLYEGQDPTKAAANLKPVGTGPFKLVSYVKGDTIKMVRNPDYFKPGLPYLDELIFKVIPQASTQILSLERGEVDYVSGIPGPDLSRLQANKDLTITKSGAGSGGSFCVTTLIYNLLRQPIDKVEVRQALAYTIDRQQILDQVNFGQGKVAISPISIRRRGHGHTASFSSTRERVTHFPHGGRIRRHVDERAALTVCFPDCLVERHLQREIEIVRLAEVADHPGVFVVADLVRDGQEAGDPQLPRERGDAARGLERPVVGLDDHEHGVDALRRRAPEMLDRGLHVEERHGSVTGHESRRDTAHRAMSAAQSALARVIETGDEHEMDPVRSGDRVAPLQLGERLREIHV